MTTQEKLTSLYSKLEKQERLVHAVKIINYDMETAAPEKGMQEDALDSAMLQNQLFAMEKEGEYISLVKDLYENHYEELNVWTKKLIRDLYKSIRINENIDEKTNAEANALFAKGYIDWINAKKEGDYSLFAPTLKAIYEMQMKLLKLRYDYLENDPYTTLFSDYEEGFTSADLDQFFSDLEKGLIPLYEKVRKASYEPRHGFLTRPVPLAKQEQFTNYLLKHNGFDFSRGSVSTTEHPFTEQFGKDDVRVTTKYIETNFISNMYSIIHEGGHAIFGQNIPPQTFIYHLTDSVLSMAKHESVSRFYENVIGRSKAYIDSIYPDFHSMFEKELGDVSKEDFYEGVNYVDKNNALRTEADELTYTLHIIIRYRIERMIFEGKADFSSLNKIWNDLYLKYLGIEVTDDSEGILQDVHWSSGFGYFPTYALGNALNCIYVKAMKKEFDFEKTIREGKMDVILAWMKEHPFASAPYLTTKEWIKELTGEEFSAKPYLDYLTDKYTKLYHLD